MGAEDNGRCLTENKDTDTYNGRCLAEDNGRCLTDNGRGLTDVCCR